MESEIQETFVDGIWKPGNICSWNLESRKHLLVESGIQASQFKIPENRFFGIRNPLRWNLESSIWDP